MAKKENEVFEAEFEIIETKLVKATPESKGVAIFAPENKSEIIQAFVNSASLCFSFTPSQCKKMVKESSKLTIKDKEDKEGFEKVYRKHREFVTARTSTDKERKTINDPFNQIKSGIDSVAKKDILEILEPEEARLKSEIDAWKAWEQEEADRIEKEEADRINQRVSELEEVGIKFDGSFYSCGENISVDIVTIKDLSDEAFSELKKRISIENEKIEKAEAVQKLHDERREKALPFLAYWDEFEKTLNFGTVSELDFSNFMERIKKAESDFKEKVRQQEEEAQKQIDERKALNYEKRSFQLEKEGFEEREEGKWLFVTESGTIQYDKNYLETVEENDWKQGLANSLSKKAEYLKEAEELAEKRKADAITEATKKAEEKDKFEFEKRRDERIDSLIKMGLKFNGEDSYIFKDINFHIGVDIQSKTESEWSEAIIGATKRKSFLDKEIAEKEEVERLQKLPEIQKAERYVEEVMKIEIPQLNGVEIAEIISEFKNQIKKASDEAISQLKKLA